MLAIFIPTDITKNMNHLLAKSFREMVETEDPVIAPVEAAPTEKTESREDIPELENSPHSLSNGTEVSKTENSPHSTSNGTDVSKTENSPQSTSNETEVLKTEESETLSTANSDEILKTSRAADEIIAAETDITEKPEATDINAEPSSEKADHHDVAPKDEVKKEIQKPPLPKIVASKPVATTPTAKTNSTSSESKSKDTGFFSDPLPLPQQRLPLVAPLQPITDSVDVPAYTSDEAKNLVKNKMILYLGDSS